MVIQNTQPDHKQLSAINRSWLLALIMVPSSSNTVDIFKFIKRKKKISSSLRLHFSPHKKNFEMSIRRYVLDLSQWIMLKAILLTTFIRIRVSVEAWGFFTIHQATRDKRGGTIQLALGCSLSSYLCTNTF